MAQPNGYSDTSQLQPCGSVAAYYRHYRADEPPCDPCRRAIASRPKPMEDRVCADCGEAITVEKGRPTRFCQSCQKSRAGRASAERSRKVWPSSPVRVVECSECEGIFTAHGSGMALRSRCAGCGPRLPQRSGVGSGNGQGQWWKFLVSGPCTWCAESFTGVAASWESRPLYCSKSCMTNAGRARRGRFLIPDHERLEIYVRDGWVCQLCEEPVDPDLGPSDVWAATLDHIVPQSWVLVPDHSPMNLRLAHRWCNSVRGDESFYDESILKAG